MKKQVYILIIMFLQFFPIVSEAADYRAFFSPSISEKEVRFIFLGNSGFLINTSKGSLIIDPATYLEDYDLQYFKQSRIDLVLYTHSHGDHFDSGTASKIFEATKAPILAEQLVTGILSGKIPQEKIISGLPGKTYTIGNITVKVIGGIHLGPINLYQIKLGDISIFHGGDSGYVPLSEYKSNIAFLPTGSPSPTCSPEESFKMAFDIKPDIVVTMHGPDYEHQSLKKMIESKMLRTSVIVPVKQTMKKIYLSDR